MSNIRTHNSGIATIIPPSARSGAPDKSARAKIDRDALSPPRHRGFTNVPAMEVLERMINRALEALQHGIYWDRGSIINIVV